MRRLIIYKNLFFYKYFCSCLFKMKIDQKNNNNEDWNRFILIFFLFSFNFETF
jgi:hypothetical protein